MLAVFVVDGAVAFYAAALVLVLLLPFLLGWVSRSPYEHLMRERRRHAERTARAMRRMTRIKAQTLQRMDRAEGRRRP
ncbi:MAG TPA: hypothetical protein VGG98_10005 [Solirubrobacteraceae bacterium]|jgi:hypothetical protein